MIKKTFYLKRLELLNSLTARQYNK